MALKKPAVLDLEPGNYFWCSCGRSQNQPFCDGSHKGTGFRPVPFTVSEKKRQAFCQCKQTAQQPFCDGSHSKITGC